MKCLGSLLRENGTSLSQYSIPRIIICNKPVEVFLVIPHRDTATEMSMLLLWIGHVFGYKFLRYPHGDTCHDTMIKTTRTIAISETWVDNCYKLALFLGSRLLWHWTINTYPTLWQVLLSVVHLLKSIWKIVVSFAMNFPR